MKVFGVNFSEDVALDRFKLEEENEALSAIYEFWASQHAAARADSERAKVTLDQIKAEKDLALRRDPPLDIKITEASMAAMVTDSSEVQKAQEMYLLANERLYNLDAAIYALAQKKGALDNLVKLWERGYYGGVNSKSTDDISDAMHEKRNR